MRARLVTVCAVSLLACKAAEPGAANKTDASKPDASKTAPAQPEQPEAAQPEVQPSEQVQAPVACGLPMAVAGRLDAVRTREAIDVSAVEELVRGPALEWLAAADLALGRMSQDKPQDVELISQWLASLPEHDLDGRQADLAAISTQLRAVAFLEMRRELGAVADEHVRGDAATQAWARARCLWDPGLRQLAVRADALPEHGGEGWEQAIAEAFADGEAALAKSDIAHVKAAKQRIEKGMYAVFQRLVLGDAEAHTRVASSEALGLLDALDDRLADRNGPGLARMRAAFNGDPAALDPAAIEQDIAIAFAKRARKYCDRAVVTNQLGTPDAIGESWEGMVYTRVILPDMRERLAAQGFDADAYVADWESYLGAVESNDAELAAELSPRLVEWNCAYQSALGITECTASANQAE